LPPPAVSWADAMIVEADSATSTQITSFDFMFAPRAWLYCVGRTTGSLPM
jgi:hypothetical protein